MSARYIFISHSSSNLEFALRISRDLLDHGYEVWIDEWNLVGGDQPYWDEIQEAIQHCTAFLYLLSPHSAERRSGARKELLHVAGMPNPPTIIPIKIQEIAYEDTPIVITAGEYQTHDFVGRTYEDAFQRTLNAISKSFSRPSAERPKAAITPFQIETMHDQVRVILCYKSTLEHDRSVARHIIDFFREKHVEIVSTTEDNVLDLNQTNAKVNFFVVLLSQQSSSSQTLAEHIRVAYELARDATYQLKIVPVRLRFAGSFPYHLEHLNHIPWLVWNSSADYHDLFSSLQSAITGNPWGLSSLKDKATLQRRNNIVIEPTPYADPGVSVGFLEQTTGAMSGDSRFYIERGADLKLLNQMSLPYMTVVVKAPRQMGKSSLIKRGKRHATQLNKSIGVVDFQGNIDKRALNDDRLFFQRFCTLVVRAFNLQKVAPAPETVWDSTLANAMCCTDYHEQYIFPELRDEPIILAIDEVDIVMPSDFKSDFFGMLRYWHNKRADDDSWRNFSLILVISTEPRMLIEDLNQSPFNVGTQITLSDFTLDQVMDLNARHNHPLDISQIEVLHEWIGGHPYLTRQALFWVANGEIDAQDLLKHLLTSHGPFDDHLTHYSNLLNQREGLGRALQHVINGDAIISRDEFARLHAAGLVRQYGGKPVPRCKLYAQYFSRLQQ